MEKKSGLYLKFLQKFFGNNYKLSVAKYISGLCEENSSVLDLGCNDGRMATYILQMKPSLKIEGIDVQDNFPCKIKRTLYNGNKIPFPDASFDIVIAIDALHHTEDISAMLGEMARVSKKFIIIKDVVKYSWLSNMIIVIADYISNVKYGIKCPNNFPDWKEWHLFFKNNSLEIIAQPKNLNFGFGLNERYNPILKLQISEK